MGHYRQAGRQAEVREKMLSYPETLLQNPLGVITRVVAAEEAFQGPDSVLSACTCARGSPAESHDG